MAASPARIPPRVIKTRSVARATLHDHLERLRKAQEAAAAARRPYARASDQVERAQAAVRNAEAALAAIDGQEAALIAAWDAAGSVWPPPSPSAEMRQARADAEDTLATARRTLSTVERSAETARGPTEQAATAIADIAKDTDSKVRDVIMENSELALARLADAMSKAAAAKSIVLSLAEALITKGWFPAAEHVNSALSSTRTAMPPTNTGPFVDLIARLATDADAVTLET